MSNCAVFGERCSKRVLPHYLLAVLMKYFIIFVLGFNTEMSYHARRKKLKPMSSVLTPKLPEILLKVVFTKIIFSTLKSSFPVEVFVIAAARMVYTHVACRLPSSWYDMCRVWEL